MVGGGGVWFKYLIGEFYFDLDITIHYKILKVIFPLIEI